MERKVKVKKNETHWRSRDTGKMVRLASRAAGVSKRIDIEVRYSSGPVCNAVISDYRVGPIHIILELPKRGRQSTAPPLLQVAEAALGTAGPILPLHQTYRIAKVVAVMLCQHHTSARGHTQRKLRLGNQLQKQNIRPSWLPEKFSIHKYAPKKKPEDKRTFIEKVKDDIKRAEERVESWEAEVEHAEAHLKRATKDLKKHQKRLRDAKKRREQ